MMRQRGYSTLPTTVQDDFNTIKQQQQQQNQHQSSNYRKSHSNHQPSSGNAASIPQISPVYIVQEQDDADAAAGSRLLQQQEQAQAQAQLRQPLLKSSSTNTPLRNIINNNNQNHTMTTMESNTTLDSYSIETAPSSVCTINSLKNNTGDLEFFEDMITEPVLVLGIDISHLTKSTQFLVCASGLFFFSLLYGYLQELLSVQLCSRKLGLFLAMTQFTGYTILAYVMRNFVYKQQQHYKQKFLDQHLQLQNSSSFNGFNSAINNGSNMSSGYEKGSKMFDAKHVPLALYLGLSFLRAIDLAMVRFNY
jgi:hypothetical protein